MLPNNAGMCVCMYRCMYVCVCVWICMYVFVLDGPTQEVAPQCMYLYIRVYIHAYVWMDSCMYARTYVRIYVHTHIHIQVPICTYVTMYPGTHMYIRTYKSLYPGKISHKYGVPNLHIYNVPALANAMVRLATNPTLLQRLRCPSPGELAARQHAFVLKSRALLLSEAPPRVLSLAAAAHPHYRRAEYIRCT